MKQIIISILAVVCCGALGAEVFALQLKKQMNNSDAPQPMTAQEISELGDPLFELFLKNQSDKVTLKELEEAVQPDASKRSLFVADERIIDPSRPQTRRAVITFSGQNHGENLKGNAMLSVFFSDTEFLDSSFIEGWGWDEDRGRYNYYRMDNGSWKFRGSSADKAQFGKSGTCFACHLNGAPVMKELLPPWNHWHSQDSQITYLDRLQPPNKKWPITSDSRFDNLRGAGTLDLMIRSAIKNFNSKKIEAAVENGKVKDAKVLLRHIFETTEFNIISPVTKSNMHPLSGMQASQPSLPLNIPSSFFLNSPIIDGGGISGFQNGLGAKDFREFQTNQALKVTPGEYKSLVDGFKLKIANQLGDADFAWLTPEPSDIDNHMIDKLMGEKIIPSQFVAAVLAVDVKQPILSKLRSSLLIFVPDEFDTSPVPASEDRFGINWFNDHSLTKKTIAKLEALDLSNNPTAKEFLDLLKSASGKSPLEELKSRVSAYAQELKTGLTGADREETLKQLFGELVARRKAVLDDPMLGHLDETGGKLLFPEAND